MRSVINLILVYALALGPVVMADPPKPSSPAPAPLNHLRVEVTIPEPAKAASSEELKQLMTEAQESMEGDDEEGNFAQRWIAKFNFYRIGLNAYRWYSVKRADPRTADQALNLVLMLLGSHTIETIGGGMLASSSVHDTNPLVIAIKTILGVGITIPGFDPLCYAVIGAYWRWPRTVNSALHYPRVAVVKSTSFLARVSGMSTVMRWMWENKSARAWLEDKLKNAKPGTYVYETTVDGFQFHFPTEKGNLVLQFKDDGKGCLGLTSLAVRGEVKGRALGSWLKLFGGNTRDAVLETVSIAEKGVKELPATESASEAGELGLEPPKPIETPFTQALEKKIFVKQARYSDGLTLVETRPEALSFGAKDTFKPWKATKAAAHKCSEWIGQADAWLNNLDK